MGKFHINKNGVPAPCKAQKGNCPLGGAESHFTSVEEAQEYADNINKKEYGIMAITEGSFQDKVSDTEDFRRDPEEIEESTPLRNGSTISANMRGKLEEFYHDALSHERSARDKKKTSQEEYATEQAIKKFDHYYKGLRGVIKTQAGDKFRDDKMNGESFTGEYYKVENVKEARTVVLDNGYSVSKSEGGKRVVSWRANEDGESKYYEKTMNDEEYINFSNDLVSKLKSSNDNKSKYSLSQYQRASGRPDESKIRFYEEKLINEDNISSVATKAVEKEYNSILKSYKNEPSIIKRFRRRSPEENTARRMRKNHEKVHGKNSQSSQVYLNSAEYWIENKSNPIELRNDFKVSNAKQARMILKDIGMDIETAGTKDGKAMYSASNTKDKNLIRSAPSSFNSKDLVNLANNVVHSIRKSNHGEKTDKLKFYQFLSDKFN